jgi:hypothetical protein
MEIAFVSFHLKEGMRIVGRLQHSRNLHSPPVNMSCCSMLDSSAPRITIRNTFPGPFLYTLQGVLKEKKEKKASSIGRPASRVAYKVFPGQQTTPKLVFFLLPCS